MAIDRILRDLANDSERVHVVSISIFVFVLSLCIVVGHLLRESRWVNESITAIFIGSSLIIGNWMWNYDIKLYGAFVCGGFLLLFTILSSLSSSSFQVKKKRFFHNFLPITLFGVAGVFMSFAIISAGCWWLFPKIGFNGLDIREYLALGIIFSSTDTVCTLQVLHQDETPLLYSLVFGEGVVNDATAVVLFNAIQKFDVSKIHGWTAVYFVGDFLYLFSSSTVLGIATGLLTAYVLKTLYFGRHSTDREIAIMILMAYLSYMLAELLQLSGILTVFFCGIVMSHYAWHNVSENSRISTRHIFATLSFIAEIFIFLYVGMDALAIEKWKVTKTSFKTALAINCIIVILVLVGRAAFVFPLSTLSNFLSSNSEGSHITFKHQVIIWWAGLMRGAVSVALAFNQFTISGVTRDPDHATMITSTTVVVLFSTLVFGMLTKPLVKALAPHRAPARAHSGSPRKDKITLPFLPTEDSPSSPLLKAKRSLNMLLERPAHTIHIYWRKFDDTYMRPVFGGPNRDSN